MQPLGSLRRGRAMKGRMPSGNELYSPPGRKRSGRHASGSAQVLCTACAPRQRVSWTSPMDSLPQTTMAAFGFCYYLFLPLDFHLRFWVFHLYNITACNADDSAAGEAWLQSCYTSITYCRYAPPRHGAQVACLDGAGEVGAGRDAVAADLVVRGAPPRDHRHH